MVNAPSNKPLKANVYVSATTEKKVSIISLGSDAARDLAMYYGAGVQIVSCTLSSDSVLSESVSQLYLFL